VLNAPDRLADGYEARCRHLKAEIALEEGQLRDCGESLGELFAHAESQSRLADLRDLLKLGLSEKPPEGGAPISEVAEEIRARRAPPPWRRRPRGGHAEGGHAPRADRRGVPMPIAEIGKPSRGVGRGMCHS
jgi:hypothetical protein